MGKINDIIKIYFEDRERFADVFNVGLFNGEAKVDPNSLRYTSTAELEAKESDDGKLVKTSEKNRDGMAEWEIQTAEGESLFALIGIESQKEVDYTMPVRCMDYDARRYMSQVRGIKRGHKNVSENETLSESEYLCKFTRADKLKPVITLVFYTGKTPWDGPKSISEMFAGGIREENAVMCYVNDYTMPLLSVVEMTDEQVEMFKTDLRAVVKFVRAGTDKAKMNKLLAEEPVYRAMARDAAALISVVTNTPIKIDEKEENVDMCLAIQAMVDDARKETREEAREEARKEFLRMIRTMHEKGYTLTQMRDLYSNRTEEEIRAALKQQGLEVKE